MSRSRKKTKKPISSSAKPSQKGIVARSPRWIWLIGGLVLIVLISTAVWAISSQSSKPSPLEISVDEAYQKYKSGVFFLDVRQPAEWAEYHVPDTTLIPLDQLESRLNELPRDEEIVVVCRSGNRSQAGRDILQKAGFPQTISMTGGLNAWQASGFPTVTGP